MWVKETVFCFFILKQSFLILHTSSRSYSLSSPPPALPTLPPTPHLFHFPVRVRPPVVSLQRSLTSLWRGPRPSPLYLGWARYPSKENGLQKASSSTRDKPWSHSLWPHRLPKPHNCRPRLGGQIRSYAGFSPVNMESVNSHELGKQYFKWLYITKSNKFKATPPLTYLNGYIV